LERVFTFLEKQPYSYEVIVVENGSTDRTFDVAQRAANNNPQLFVLHDDRAGKGNAVRRGFLAAHGEYRFLCDADLSMPIEELGKFLPSAMADFDIAIGSREAQGAVRYNEPSYRHWGGRVINLAIRLLILPGFHDTQCGYKCFRAQTTEALFRQQTVNGWAFDIELLYIAKRRNLRIREIPIQWIFYADSKVSAVRDAIRMMMDIFQIRINDMRGRYDFSA